MSNSRAGLDPRAAVVVELFENLSPADLDHLDRCYASDAWFKDPFNEVRGIVAITAIFRHMFVALLEPRFVVRDVMVQGNQCFLSWDFVFRMRRFNTARQTIRGASHLVFDINGRIASHRDYWDAAEELYEKLPLVGSLMRWLKRRAAG